MFPSQFSHVVTYRRGLMTYFHSRCCKFLMRENSRYMYNVLCMLCNPWKDVLVVWFWLLSLSFLSIYCVVYQRLMWMIGRRILFAPMDIQWIHLLLCGSGRLAGTSSSPSSSFHPPPSLHSLTHILSLTHSHIHSTTGPLSPSLPPCSFLTHSLSLSFTGSGEFWQWNEGSPAPVCNRHLPSTNEWLCRTAG